MEKLVRATQVMNVVSTVFVEGDSIEFFCSIRILQLQAQTGLVPLRYPSTIIVYNKFTNKFANMDVVGDIMEAQYGNLDFEESPPFSSYFEGYGMDSMNYVSNSGSFFFFMGLIPAVVYARLAINLVCLCLRKRAFARRVGMFVYVKNKNEFMMLALTKLVLETYTDLCICSFLQMMYYYNPNDIVDKLWAQQGEFDKESGTTLFSSGFGEFFCHTCGFVACLTVFIYPLWSGIMILVDHRYKKLPDQYMRNKYSVLMDGTRQGGLAPKLLNVSYMLRRLMVNSIIIFMQFRPDIQIILLLAISMTNGIYLAAVKPYENKRQNKLESFNEVILTTSYIIALVFEFHHPTKDSMVVLTYTHIGLTGINILASIVSMVFSFFLAIKKYWVKY